MPHLKFEIVCFCPCWKKAVRGGIWGKTPPVTSLLLIFSSPTKLHCLNPYLLLGKQRRVKPWGIGVMCPCWFKAGGHREQTQTHHPALNLYSILFLKVLIRHYIWCFINNLVLVMLLNKFVPNSTIRRCIFCITF